MSKKEDHEYTMVSMSTLNDSNNSSSNESMSPKGRMRQRGLLDSSSSSSPSPPPRIVNSIPNNRSAANSPFQFYTTATKHWRWWNYLLTLIFFIAIVEVILFIVSAILLSFPSDTVTFNIRQYPKILYQPLNTSTHIQLTADSTVYHVTKEFGPAAMGGMGSVLTAITQAQLLTGKITPYVVLPFYSFIKTQTQYPIKKTVDLVITVRNAQNKPESVEFKVSELQYDFNPIENFESLSEEEKLEILTVAKRNKQKVTVYLIGPAKNHTPLNRAFRASDITSIYSSPKILPQEWKDQYFDKAVASFLAWKATGKHEQSLFAALDKAVPKVDVVHLHGATNAYVAKYLTEYEKQMGPTTPTIVYTMHDYLDELQYTNTLHNVEKFLNTPKHGRSLKQDVQDGLVPYTFGKNRVFMSPMAIDMADVVTFVSRTMAQDMIEGRLEFYLKEVVLDRLLRKAEMNQFFGVSNGLDFTGSINPFTESKLMEHGLNYPLYAKSLIDTKLEVEKTITNYWPLSSYNGDFVSNSKRRAKQFLVDQGLLRPVDVDRPLVLFVGRFQYNKGLETFEEAAKLFQLHDMKFAIIGQPNNYPLNWVKSLAKEYPDNIVLMTHTHQQRDWLIYFRAASDFVYVPSITESFGLVAAEGLMFGASVISTGTGGLAEFLIDQRLNADTPLPVVSDLTIESEYTYNAYLFDSLTTSGSNRLQDAVRRASDDYDRIKHLPALHEEYVLRMMLSAYALGWDRGNEQGPVYDYLHIYQKATQEKRAASSFILDSNDF